MNNQLIIKWCKRVGIAIASAVAIFFLYALSYYIYEGYYIPRHIESLYQEGLSNPNKAENNIKQLLEEYEADSQTKALNLMKFYADKNELWAQILLEQFNEERGLPLNSKIPINKHIWGITLGKSTKQDVLNYLDSINLMHLELENGSVTQVLDGFEFAGVFWDKAYCYFSNNKIYKIRFWHTTDSFDSGLMNMLTTKYTLSKKFDISNISIKDSCILIELNYPYSKAVRLEYTDIKAKNKKLQQDINSI
jgi:hypothetical protein